MESQTINNQTTDNPSENAWAVILLSAIGVYMLFKKPKKSETLDEKSKKLDSYSKFRKTPMGASIDEQIADEGLELSSKQIMKLDECLQGLTEQEYRVLEKASNFVKKEELYAALDEAEWKTFKPLRKKIMECVDEAING
jgi:hypothetical protein